MEAGTNVTGVLLRGDKGVKSWLSIGVMLGVGAAPNTRANVGVTVGVSAGVGVADGVTGVLVSRGVAV